MSREVTSAELTTAKGKLTAVVRGSDLSPCAARRTLW